MSEQLTFTLNPTHLKMQTGSSYASATSVAVLVMVASTPSIRTRLPAVARETGTRYRA